MADLNSKWRSLGMPRIAVVGDIILDRYHWAAADRISPEAPVLVLRSDHDEDRVGGAACVASFLKTLHCNVTLFGVIGSDLEGHAILRLLRDAVIDTGSILIDSSRPTTIKTRILGSTDHRQPHQLIRLDRESRAPIAIGQSQQILQALSSQLTEFDGILISDYGKGVCSDGLLKSIFHLGKVSQIPIAVDPAKGISFERYRGAPVLTPNRLEAANAANISIQSIDAAEEACHKLRQEWNLSGLVLKLDRDGMLVSDNDLAPSHIKTSPRDVCDVTGAGDMVLAVLGLCLSEGWPLREAAQLANTAAGLEVQEIGVTTINRDQIWDELRRTENWITRNKRVSLKQAQELAEQYRRSGKRVVLTNGCFDLLHFGHLTCFEQAAACGDVLIVGVNSDASIRRLKGSKRPIVKEWERLSLIAALQCVDHVILFDDDTPLEMLNSIRPDVLVKGAPYSVTEVIGHEFVESYGGRVCVVTQMTNTSTSGIIQSILHSAATSVD